MIDESKPKVFGLDTVNDKGNVFVVEGPIDSMFMPNCVAMAGSAISLEQVFPNKLRSEITIVMDNEPRNKDIVKQIDKYIDDGYNVCIWPDNIQEKDINDMILAGLDPEWIIVQNTRNGLTAKAALSQWKRI
jgi:hypothetical protein